ncbi:hypothetical protein K2173_026901 [Erythroxylum novogranatense]|uniref:Integrase catalytic domain-containing protein n=1 Tax=Erythroxylum novogranatense TaxID=1862640 RepID=A0AAV8U0A8_9ROSI|nr:hypothetical protein K2173_026901 [Erythroxylum novogranatense]
MKSYGENISKAIVVVKALRSKTPKFEHIVAAIEEVHDLSDYSFDKLMSSLQAHSSVNGEPNQKEMKENSSGRGRHKGSFHGRGHGRDQGRGRGRGGSNEERQNRTFVCHYCKRLSHKEAYCWQKQKDENHQASFAEKTDEESKLFMALFCEKDASNDVWFLDNGYSNHMSRTRSLFKEIDDSKKSEVTLLDNKKIQVKGKGIVSIKTSQGEFVSTNFNNFCATNGIHRELITPCTPEQNGVAKRKNRTIVEMARNMMQAKGLPNSFWAEAIATAIYLLNVSPTKAIPNQTPFEAWMGRRPTVSHLRVFGCLAYSLVKTHSHKFDEKSEKYIIVGYFSQSKAYELYNPISGKIFISKDVAFNEDAKWIWNKKMSGSISSIQR